jgi:hypothetical protein
MYIKGKSFSLQQNVWITNDEWNESDDERHEPNDATLNGNGLDDVTINGYGYGNGNATTNGNGDANATNATIIWNGSIQPASLTWYVVQHRI